MREMREAVLQRAFEGLGAREATSEAFVDNAASNSVSQRLGYQPNGTNWATRRGELAELRCWRLTRERWQPRGDCVIDGLLAAQGMLEA